MNIQERVLNELWLKGGEMKISELVKGTNLSSASVHRALIHLRNRGLVLKRKEERKIGYKMPPGPLLIKINPKTEIRVRQLLNK